MSKKPKQTQLDAKPKTKTLDKCTVNADKLALTLHFYVTFIENFNYMMKMGIFPSLKVVEQVSTASFPPCCDKDGAHWLVQFPNYLKS